MMRARRKVIGPKEAKSCAWSVCFSNRAENLGLGEISASREQYVPCVGKFVGLQDEQNRKEDGGEGTKGPENQQPGLVSESSGHESDSERESEDEQEGLQTSSIQHQVELWMCIERNGHQERCQQHGQEHHAQGG
jgi:hypothetical protein